MLLVLHDGVLFRGKECVTSRDWKRWSSLEVLIGKIINGLELGSVWGLYLYNGNKRLIGAIIWYHHSRLRGNQLDRLEGLGK